MTGHDSFLDPGREFTLVPFWFWNDVLDREELRRQIADFEAHGVYGFIIHPRVGLPREMAWLSDEMMDHIRFAVEEAARRDMVVVLYDEGMYPSGSSCGQVVAANPDHQCRCLAKVDLAEGQEPVLAEGQNLVAVVRRANGQRTAIIDRKVDAYIRGIHYIGGGPDEDEPPAGDILNPDAVASFVHLVYDRYAQVLGDHFGTTVKAIFTDEPGVLGRCRERGVRPGTTGILEHVNAFLGYDFTPHLPALWHDDEPDADRYRGEYRRAIMARLEETYYRQLYEWCERHGLPLTGHPASGEEIGPQRWFHIPGQDIVWRWVSPHDPSALEGKESTQAKCGSSAMIHLGRRRNSNECYGAFGHDLTWQEMKWLADWCFVRGVNLLYPHAFFYSIRGPRWDERPPDVGPHSAWWGAYKPFADYARRMCWLNTDSQHVCHLAILGESAHLPWEAAKVCFHRQRDFNYLEVRHLWDDARVDGDGIHLAGMRYRALIIDDTHVPSEAMPMVEALAQAGRLILWRHGDGAAQATGASLASTPDELVAAIDALVPPDLVVEPASEDLRYRHVVKGGAHYYLLCNEGASPIRCRLGVSVAGQRTLIDPFSVDERVFPDGVELVLVPYATMVLRVAP